MEEDKYKILKVACVVIYTLVVILLISLIIKVYRGNNVGVIERTQSSDITIKGNNNNVTINYIVKEPYEGYISNIVAVRQESNDDDFTYEDASYIFYKIKKYASKYNINLKDALVLVNVESDFNKDAYNSNGKAFGLCQITKICLDDFNLRTKNSYTLGDMYNIDKNLEVGFWYFNRLLRVYGQDYDINSTRDAYFSYNLGAKEFYKNRTSYRVGLYPNKKKYNPATRYDTIDYGWKNI